jgi:hypothetical protein
MIGTSRRRAAVGAAAVGLAVGAGGLFRAAMAEPIKMPLLPVALSQPKDDQPTWTASGGVVPAAVTPPPRPAEPAPAPRPVPGYELAPPARPSNSAGVVQPAPLPQPVFNLQSAAPRLTVEAGTPVGPSAPPAAVELPPPPGFEPPGGVPPPTPAPGDAPMPALTRQLVMSAAFGAALAAAPLAPVAAQDDAKKGQTDTGKKDDIADIKKQLEDIQKDVQSLQRFRKSLEDEVFGKPDGKALADMGLIKRLTEIESKINRIEATLNQISARLGDPSKSTSAFAPPAPGAAVGRAFVRIVNEYPTEMSMLVNGRSYRVLPGQTATVEVPPGGYTYELLHTGSQPVTSTVKEGETVTLRIR